MGCWGYGIMESDDALDFEYEYLCLAGIDPDAMRDAACAAQVREKLEACMPALFERARTEPIFEDQTQFRAVAYQALAVMLMQAGCALSDEQHAELLEGVQNCYEYRLAKTMQAEAASEGRNIEEQDLVRHDIEEGYGGHVGYIERLYGRIQAIETQVDLLRAYPITGGVPVETPSRGLFEVALERQMQQ